MADPRELLAEALVHLRAINAVFERLLDSPAAGVPGAALCMTDNAQEVRCTECEWAGVAASAAGFPATKCPRCLAPIAGVKGGDDA